MSKFLPKTVSPLTQPRPKTAVTLFTAVALSTLISQWCFSFDCKDCSLLPEIQTKVSTLTKTLKRLTEILDVNETYLLSLNADADSSRMKAQSNISIAKKRITQNQEDLDLATTGTSGEILKNCQTGDCTK